MPKAYLVLADATVYEGEGFGASGEALGELVFTTGMEGYLETLTDPSYAGQIIMQTFPLIGNYGVIEADFEGKARVMRADTLYANAAIRRPISDRRARSTHTSKHRACRASAVWIRAPSRAESANVG